MDRDDAIALFERVYGTQIDFLAHPNSDGVIALANGQSCLIHAGNFQSELWGTIQEQLWAVFGVAPLNPWVQS